MKIETPSFRTVLCSKCTRCFFTILALFFVQIVLSHCSGFVFGQEFSREKFYQDLGKVRRGMSPNDVEAILGGADDVWSKRKKNRFFSYQVKFVYCYGSLEKGSFPTLGRVEFNRDSEVSRVIGADKHPIEAKGIAEPQLRGILTQIDKTPSIFLSSDYNPFDAVAIANHVHSFGQEVGYSVLREYLRVAGGQKIADGKVYTLLLCLHEPIDERGYVPLPKLGITSPPYPRNRTDFPQFPIYFLDDTVPLLLTQGFVSAGIQDSPSYYIDALESEATWRKERLRISQKSRIELNGELQNLFASKFWFVDDKNAKEIEHQLQEQLAAYFKSRASNVLELDGCEKGVRNQK